MLATQSSGDAQACSPRMAAASAPRSIHAVARWSDRASHGRGLGDRRAFQRALKTRGLCLLRRPDAALQASIGFLGSRDQLRAPRAPCLAAQMAHGATGGGTADQPCAAPLS
eukprot:4229598-Pyramimonas_sp.AAC.1